MSYHFRKYLDYNNQLCGLICKIIEDSLNRIWIVGRKIIYDNNVVCSIFDNNFNLIKKWDISDINMGSVYGIIEDHLNRIWIYGYTQNQYNINCIVYDINLNIIKSWTYDVNITNNVNGFDLIDNI